MAPRLFHHSSRALAPHVDGLDPSDPLAGWLKSTLGEDATAKTSKSKVDEKPASNEKPESKRSRRRDRRDRRSELKIRTVESGKEKSIQDAPSGMRSSKKHDAPLDTAKADLNALAKALEAATGKSPKKSATKKTKGQDGDDKKKPHKPEVEAAGPKKSNKKDGQKDGQTETARQAAMAENKAKAEIRKRFASKRLLKMPVMARRVVAKDPPVMERAERTSSQLRRPKASKPLVKKLYEITSAAASTQAQKMLLEFLEKNHALLGEHGEKLLEAQRKSIGNLPLESESIEGTELNATLLETYETLEQALKKSTAKPSAFLPAIPENWQKGEIKAEELHLKAIDVPQPPVPVVVYGLDRVLFNPGVYHLRDSHSQVYNFDPYLETITPVKEFDFSALKEYITSSRDKALISIAAQEKTKYTGSTSSMTSALAHFHYLLSKWRPLNLSALSRGFPNPLESFSAMQRAPTGIFLRWRDGVYAIDANKEFDSANVLMYLGKSMERFLTMEKEEYEKFTKKQSHTLSEEEKDTPESYHYTTMGDFLMRSQLDAYDPRLPGTGMFDLKTRAVVSIRKDATNFEPGLGYEIRNRRGEWESFEREYYDLCRAAFMKYSLQARMGRMDGIFVAYHNVERIFGFQYLPIASMDEAIHGTGDTALGDAEFRVSVDYLNQCLDILTAKFPGESLQIDFETRPAGKDGDCFMYIFAQPTSEEEIKAIQETNLAEIQKYERSVIGLDSKQQAEMLKDAVKKEAKKTELEDEAERLEMAIEHPFKPENTEILRKAVERMNEHDSVTENAVHRALEMVEQRLQEELDDDSAPASAVEGEETHSKAEEVKKEKKSTKPLLGLKLTIRNFVNGVEVLRPENLTASDKWEVKYGILTMSGDMARTHYQKMKSRKQKIHGPRREQKGEDVGQRRFEVGIKEAVEGGRRRREEMNARDKELGVKSLADTKGSFEPVKAEGIRPELKKQVVGKVFTKEAQTPKDEEKDETKDEKPKGNSEKEKKWWLL